MDGHVAAAATAADSQRTPSQPRGVSISTKKISFSFGGVSSTRGSSSSTATPSASLPPSTSSVRSSSFRAASGSGRLGVSSGSSSTAAVPPKKVLSIFCSNDEDDTDRRSRPTEHVLSFDKYSGWEKKATDDASKEKQNAPLVIPCLHPLKPPRRVVLKSEQAQGTPVAKGPSESNDTRSETEQIPTKAAAGAGQETRVSAGGQAAVLGWKNAVATRAAGGELPTGDRGAGVETAGNTAAGERTLAEGYPCEEAERKKGGSEITGIHPAAPCGDGSDVSGAATRDQGGSAEARTEHSSGEQTTTQQPQEERGKGSIQFGLIKRGPAARAVEPRSSALALGGRGHETGTPSSSNLIRRTIAESCENLSSFPEAAAATRLAAAGAVDADELAAQALIAEAKGENAAAITAAWTAAEAARDDIPILARNTELAALRRKFRERMSRQQQQQRQDQQQQSEQAQQETEQLQQRKRRGRGPSFYDRPEVFPGSTDLLSRSKGDRYTLGGAEADVNSCSSGSGARSAVATSSRGHAGAEAGGHNGVAGANASSSISETAAASDPAAGGGGGRKYVSVDDSVSGERGNSQTQQQTNLTREEAEKELLRQELDLLPDAPQAHSAAYATVPVSEFGIAMLRGMGYDPAAATAKTAAAGDEENKTIKKRVYTRAGLGSEVEVDRLWQEREKKLKEEAMKEKKKKLEEMQNSRYHR